MTIVPTIFSLSPFIDLPQGLVGWVGFFTLLGVTLLLQWRWRKYNKRWGNTQRLWFIFLAFGALIFNLFIGIFLPAGNSLPPTGIPADPGGATTMLFAAVPWILGAGLLGPLPGALLALIAGLVRALWDTHNIFTPLELVLLATLFGVFVRQRYRTMVYRLLRDPLASSIFLAILYPLIYIMTTVLAGRGELVNRVDYAMSNIGSVSLAMGVEIIIAGLAAEVVSRMMPAIWDSKEPLTPSPAEKSLHTRILYNLAPLAVVLVLTLMIGNWVVAGRTAQNMWRDRMADAAVIAAQNVPYYLESGQNLIMQMAKEPTLVSGDTSILTETLAAEINTVPFFDQLILLDKEGETIAAYPSREQAGMNAPIEELMGVQLALLSGIPIQSFTIAAAEGHNAAQVSFVATIKDPGDSDARILVGRSYLDTNPMMRSILSSINSLTEAEGQGILLDEDGKVLVHSNPGGMMDDYVLPSPVPEEPIFYTEAAPDGSRRLVYFQPTQGRPWAVVMMVPASYSQSLALTIAAPLLVMILVLSIIAVVVLSRRLNSVTASLQGLAKQAGHLAQGKLDTPLNIDGEDEVGQLRRAFEHMRKGLKASNLEMSEAVHPILDAALVNGASAARIVLTPSAIPALNDRPSTPVSYGLGPSQKEYRELDDQIMAFTRQQKRLVLSNVSRPRLLNIPPGAPSPASLMAVALRYENMYFGTMWVAHDEPHTFTEEEVRFMATLGGQAAVAASKARLFQNAEIGRQRLEAILSSSPDPILVTDKDDCLLLANPAAWKAIGFGTQVEEGIPIQEMISDKDLLELVRSSSDDKQIKEILLPDGKTYLAAATPVLSDGMRVGRVCIMQDVTYLKELDSLKSEFVSTVSHDLRSPLTLMRGYATMLEMVGKLNEQQSGYVRKIVSGVESMTRLVTNLLDLGRIEAGVGLKLEMISVHDVVERVVNALQLQAAQKRIQLTMDIPQQTVPVVQADQALLQQALHNLVENAIKYTEAKGKVHMRVLAGPLGMVFEVKDTGIGISPMDQQHLFKKFYRGAQQDAKAYQGTGLGLAIVKSIAERHGGRAWVKSIAERHGGRAWADSQLGKGSVFYLALPLRQPQDEE